MPEQLFVFARVEVGYVQHLLISAKEEKEATGKLNTYLAEHPSMPCANWYMRGALGRLAEGVYSTFGAINI